MFIIPLMVEILNSCHLNTSLIFSIIFQIRTQNCRWAPISKRYHWFFSHQFDILCDICEYGHIESFLNSFESYQNEMGASYLHRKSRFVVEFWLQKGHSFRHFRRKLSPTLLFSFLRSNSNFVCREKASCRLYY